MINCNLRCAGAASKPLCQPRQSDSALPTAANQHKRKPFVSSRSVCLRQLRGLRVRCVYERDVEESIRRKAPAAPPPPSTTSRPAPPPPPPPPETGKQVLEQTVSQDWIVKQPCFVPCCHVYGKHSPCLIVGVCSD